MEYAHRSDLIDRKLLRELRKRDDTRAWLQAGSHFGAIAVTGVLLWAAVYGPLPGWLAIPIGLVHGILINYLYAAQHELMHGTPFTNKAINEFFSRITGFLVLYPRDYDRFLHFTHHTYTNIAGKDPELHGFNAQAKPYTWLSFGWRLLGVQYWIRRVRTITRCAFDSITVEQYLSEADRAQVVREARGHLVGYVLIALVSIATGSWLAAVLWLIPLLATKAFHEIQNVVEHNGLPMVADVTRNTRTINTNPVWRWLAWNMQYHCDHHLFAMVPFYNLPRLHEALAGKIENETGSYFEAVRDIIENPRSRSDGHTA